MQNRWPHARLCRVVHLLMTDKGALKECMDGSASRVAANICLRSACTNSIALFRFVLTAIICWPAGELSSSLPLLVHTPAHVAIQTARHQLRSITDRAVCFVLHFFKPGITIGQKAEDGQLRYKILLLGMQSQHQMPMQGPACTAAAGTKPTNALALRRMSIRAPPRPFPSECSSLQQH